MPPTGKADGNPSASKKIMEVRTLKKYLLVLLVTVVLLGISACSEDDNSTEPRILGYLLDQFVDIATVQEITDPSEGDLIDFRMLYNYEIVAEDGYSPRQREDTAGYDLYWDTFKTGYMVPADEYRTRFLDETTPGAFDVKNAATIRLYRRIVIADSLGNSYYKELGALPVYTIQNWDNEDEAAVKLSDLISGHQNFSTVKLMASDGYSKEYSPEEIADGYYLLESERTTFPTFNDDMQNSQKKFKYVDKIELDINFGAAIPQYENAENSKSDLQIALPELYDGYEAVELDLTDN
jgi:hypothetical protein